MKPRISLVMVISLFACAAGVHAEGRAPAVAAAGGPRPGAVTRPGSAWPEPGTTVHGVFVGISTHLGAPGVAGGSVILGRRTYAVGTMGESWAGVSVGGTGGKKSYGFALLDVGFIGIAGGKAGLGYYKDRDDDEGAQLEIGLGIMAGFVYGRLRSSARSRERHAELGAMLVLPVCEC